MDPQFKILNDHMTMLKDEVSKVEKKIMEDATLTAPDIFLLFEQQKNNEQAFAWLLNMKKKHGGVVDLIKPNGLLKPS